MSTENKHIIAMVSGKGGTGKSVITANIISKIAEEGKKCLIWDADSMYPNQHLLFGIEPPVRLSEVYAGNLELTNAFYTIKPNIDILADQPATELAALYSDTVLLDAWEKLPDDRQYDYTFIDCPAGAGPIVMQSCFIADTIIVMLTDEPTSMLDAYGLIKILIQSGLEDKIKILVNNVIDEEDAEEVYIKLDLVTQKFLNKRFDSLGFIIYDRIVRNSIMNQELFVNISPEANIVQCITKVKNRILNI